MSNSYGPGESAGKRSWPFEFVVCVAGPPISAGELTRTTAPDRTPPCASLTVPIRDAVNPCAMAATGSSQDVTPRRSSKPRSVRAVEGPRRTLSI